LACLNRSAGFTSRPQRVAVLGAKMSSSESDMMAK